MLRKPVIATLGRRLLSSSVATVSPREAIARNLLMMERIKAAKTDAELAAVVGAPLPSVDLGNLPAELSHLTPFFASSVTGGGDKYIPDPTAWQNMGFLDFVQVEARRAETWPFLVGFGTVILGGFALSASLSKEGEKDSRYMQLLERARGNVPKEAHGHAHH